MPSDKNDQSLAGKLIQSFLEKGSDNSMLDLIEYAKKNSMSDMEIASLARGMAYSGAQLKFDSEVCDIPSTGGPSSLSTLLCPLLLKVLGAKIIKIGVPGRPAGGIDVLSQIKGYEINPSINQIHKWFDKNQYVHIVANENYAPLDAKLFAFRKKNDSIGIHSLVIASLLSKKIAVDLKKVGLDIRVSEFGNFGTYLGEAQKNAQSFIAIAKLVGIEATCFITNGNVPQQPYIGRGEALLALKKIFNNDADAVLKTHLASCYQMAQSLTGNSETTVELSDLGNAFFENITVQNGDIQSFHDIASEVEKLHLNVIIAPRTGILKVDLKQIRDAINLIQATLTSLQFPDPCGIILKAMPDEYVQKGTILCTYRCINAQKENFEHLLKSAFEIVGKLQSPIFNTVSSGEV